MQNYLVQTIFLKKLCSNHPPPPYFETAIARTITFSNTSFSKFHLRPAQSRQSQFVPTGSISLLFLVCANIAAFKY